MQLIGHKIYEPKLSPYTSVTTTFSYIALLYRYDLLQPLY